MGPALTQCKGGQPRVRTVGTGKKRQKNAEGTLGRVGVPQLQSGLGPVLSEAAACRCL